MTRACDCGNEEFLYVKDLNLDKVWKAGNKYCRVCTACGSRYFLAKSMYAASEDQYVILDGENTPIPIFQCPNRTCGETVTGLPDACPYCDVDYVWETPAEEAEEVVADDEPASVSDVLEDDDPEVIEIEATQIDDEDEDPGEDEDDEEEIVEDEEPDEIDSEDEDIEPEPATVDEPAAEVTDAEPAEAAEAE